MEFSEWFHKVQEMKGQLKMQRNRWYAYRKSTTGPVIALFANEEDAWTFGEGWVDVVSIPFPSLLTAPPEELALAPGVPGKETP